MVFEISPYDLVPFHQQGVKSAALCLFFRSGDKYTSTAPAGECQGLSPWIPEILVVVSVLGGLSHHGVAQALCDRMEESGEGSSLETLAFIVIIAKHTQLG